MRLGLKHLEPDVYDYVLFCLEVGFLHVAVTDFGGKRHSKADELVPRTTTPDGMFETGRMGFEYSFTGCGRRCNVKVGADVSYAAMTYFGWVSPIRSGPLDSFGRARVYIEFLDERKKVL